MRAAYITGYGGDEVMAVAVLACDGEEVNEITSNITARNHAMRLTAITKHPLFDF